MRYDNSGRNQPATFAASDSNRIPFRVYFFHNKFLLTCVNHLNFPDTLILPARCLPDLVVEIPHFFPSLLLLRYSKGASSNSNASRIHENYERTTNQHYNEQRWRSGKRVGNFRGNLCFRQCWDLLDDFLFNYLPALELCFLTTFLHPVELSTKMLSHHHHRNRWMGTSWLCN